MPKDFAAVVKRIQGIEPDPEDHHGVAFDHGHVEHSLSLGRGIDQEAPRRLDPDPVSVLLAALGVLGSFASLAAYGGSRPERQRDRRRARRTVIRSIAATREALEDVDASLERLERLIRQGGAKDNSDRAVDYLNAPVSFGSVNAFFDFFELAAYRTLAQRVTRAFDTTVRETFEIMDAIEDGAIEAPNDLFLELRDSQSRLETLRRSQRSFGDTIDATRAVTQRLTRIADDLERCIAFDRTG